MRLKKEEKMEEKSYDTETFIKTYLKRNTKPYYFWRAISFFLAYFFYRPTFIGKENIPEEGPVVLASNHCHLPDPGFVLISTRRVVRYLAKKQLHDSIMGPIYKAACTIPVDREHGAHNSLVTAEVALRQGEVIGIFPEGTRNKKGYGTLLPFKIGAVKMAKETGAKIVPIALVSRGKPFIDPYKIIIGEAYTIGPDSDLNEENDILREKIDKLLKENS